jgi:hypothetical protein
MFLAGLQGLFKYMSRDPDSHPVYPAACFLEDLQRFLIMKVGSCAPHSFFGGQYQFLTLFG